MNDVDDIPCTYTLDPEGHATRLATWHELEAAGFYSKTPAELREGEPDEEPLEEVPVSGVHEITPILAAQILRKATFLVLTDPTGNIVASWGEGRWWAPAESDEFLARLAS